MSRSDGRTRDLRGDLLDRLQSNAGLTSLLEDVVADASAVIRPAFSVKKWHRDPDSRDPPDTALAVSVVTASSDRENAQERVSLTVQVEHEFRAGIAPSIGVLPWADAVADEISGELTAHRPGWTARGVTGGTSEPLWNDDRNRYVAVQRFDIERHG
jgi:hypothetical protein